MVVHRCAGIAQCAGLAHHVHLRSCIDNSRDIHKELEGAIIDALSAHSTMSKQALESAVLRADLKAVLLGAGKLWEGLRAKASGAGNPA